MKLLNTSGLMHLWSIINNRKVDKVDGKGLSTNDFSNTYKDKLDNIEDEFGQIGTQILRNTNAGLPITTETSNLWEKGLWTARQGIVTSIDVSDCPDSNIKKGWRISDDLTTETGVIIQNGLPLIAGKEYTLSVYHRGSTSNGLVFLIANGATPNNHFYGTTSNWRRSAFTFIAGASTEIRIGLATVATGVVELCGAKLELGDVATRWSPAPESLYSQITQVESTFNQRANIIETSVTNLRGDMTNALQTIGRFPIIQTGCVYLDGNHPNGLHGMVVFDDEFEAVPSVIATFQGDGSGTIKPTVSVYDTTTTGFHFLVQDVNNINSYDAFMNWIAILN